MSLTNEDREALAAVSSAHMPDPDWKCTCGEDCFGGTAAYSWALFTSHRDGKIIAAVEQIVARHVAEARAAALNEAAEAIQPGGTGGPGELPEHWSAIERLSFLSGMDRAARIVRNLAATPPP